MVEIIDKETGTKLIALVLCGIGYGDYEYVVYSVRRGKEDANVFVSKVVCNSEGMVLDSCFENGEKEILEGFVQRIFNKEDKKHLEEDGIQLKQGVHLEGICYFDIEKCYVTTILVSYIKECLLFYQLLDKEMLNRPVVQVREDKRKFNEGFVSNAILILLGVIILVFCLGILYEVFVK